MKQTAVEWLDEQIEYISIQIIDGFLTIKEFMEEREKLFKQAKEMEKKQIIYAWYIGVENEGKKHSHTYLWGRIDLAKEYYNETFKK